MQESGLTGAPLKHFTLTHTDHWLKLALLCQDVFWLHLSQSLTHSVLSFEVSLAVIAHNYTITEQHMVCVVWQFSAEKGDDEGG